MNLSQDAGVQAIKLIVVMQIQKLPSPLNSKNNKCTMNSMKEAHNVCLSKQALQVESKKY